MPMNISTKFHACIRMCMIIVISRSTIRNAQRFKLWYLSHRRADEAIYIQHCLNYVSEGTKGPVTL